MRPIGPILKTSARLQLATLVLALFAVNSPNLIFATEAALPTVRYAVTGRTSTDWPWFIAKAMIEASRWLYDAKNKEEALGIHVKYLKGNREGAESDYKFLVEEFKPWPTDGTTSKQGMDKRWSSESKAVNMKARRSRP